MQWIYKVSLYIKKTISKILQIFNLPKSLRSHLLSVQIHYKSSHKLRFLCARLKRKIQQRKTLLVYQTTNRFYFQKNGGLAIDFLGKLETIDKDFMYISKKSRLNVFNLPKRNISKAKAQNNFEINSVEDIKKSLSSQAKKIIIELYGKDFELLNYEI